MPSKSCRPSNARPPKGEPFTGRSTTQDAYLPWDSATFKPAVPFKPKSTATMGDFKFQPSTTHKDVRCLRAAHAPNSSG